MKKHLLLLAGLLLTILPSKLFAQDNSSVTYQDIRLSNDSPTIELDLNAYPNLETVAVYTKEVGEVDLSIFSNSSVAEIRVYIIGNSPKRIYSSASLNDILNFSVSLFSDANGKDLSLDILSQIPNVKELSLRTMNLTELPEAIYGLSKLEKLDIASNQIRELTPSIGDLKNLKSLKLGESSAGETGNPIDPSGLKYLNNLDQLSFLNIVGCSNIDLADITSQLNNPNLKLHFTKDQCADNRMFKKYTSSPYYISKGKSVVKGGGSKDKVVYYSIEINLN